MNTRTMALSASLVLSVAIAAAGSAVAQGMMGGSGEGMTGGGMMQGDQNMMRPNAMGSMMCPMMGKMMQGHQSRMSGAGMGALFGSRVVPKMNLSVDDVRTYLDAQIDRLGNKRLKVGKVNADGEEITADIVTADNSLVQRMKVDRSTGDIEYEN